MIATDLIGKRVRWTHGEGTTEHTVTVGTVRAVGLVESSSTAGYFRIVLILEIEGGELRSYSRLWGGDAFHVIEEGEVK